MRQSKVPLIVSLLLVSGLSLANAAYDDPNVLSVEKEGGKSVATYSAQELTKTFPPKIIETNTPWTNGAIRRYRGASLKEVLAKNGLSDATIIEGIALDDYQAKLEMNEINTFDPIIATEIGCTDADRSTTVCATGQEFRPLTDADRGPYYVVWPYDQLPKASDPGDNSRWIWFLVALRPES
ncbi:hypothetical protein LJR231_005915 [Phyllobacterium sp. LjRoot231]|uniref:hypothetical protein n=1 Tax=Phyllobacterium sp. LjRoot231 TaxID=3342289 RepID=UPI003ECC3227